GATIVIAGRAGSRCKFFARGRPSLRDQKRDGSGHLQWSVICLYSPGKIWAGSWGARFIVKFRPSASGLGCVILFVEAVKINVPEQAREEMIKYCTAHPKSPTATHRPQLSLRNGLWIALLGPSVVDGLLRLGSTVQGA